MLDAEAPALAPRIALAIDALEERLDEVLAREVYDAHTPRSSSRKGATSSAIAAPIKMARVWCR